MGDNLKAASRFVSQSMMSLDLMMTSGPLKQTTIIDHLADVQRGAKTMRARAIYRAAQSAVNMLNSGQSNDRVQSELGVVRTLVEQYKSGLDDVFSNTVPLEQAENDTALKPVTTIIDEHNARLSVATAQGEAVAVTPVNDMIADLNIQLSEAMNPITPLLGEEDDNSPAIVSNEIPSDNHSKDKGVLAIDEVPQDLRQPLSDTKFSLEPLIQYAPEAEQRGALRRLSALYAETQEIPKKDMPQTAVDFESLMPELTNIVLTSARHSAKTVSISFAANGVRIGVSLADRLRPALIDLCNLLVRRSLETPQIRRERGESGAGHVSIITGLDKGKINITAECTGRDIDRAELNIPSLLALHDAGGQIDLNRDGDRFQLKIVGLPAYLHRTTPAGANSMGANLEHAS